MMEAIFLLLATYFVHSTAFLATAWALERFVAPQSPVTRELLWRFVLIAGIATASVHVAWTAVCAEVLGAEHSSTVRTPAVALAASTDAWADSSPPSSQLRVAQRTVPVTGAAPRRDSARDASISQRAAWALPAFTRALASWIAILWLAVSLLGATTLALALIRRSLVLARFAPCADPQANDFVRRVCSASGLRTPRLVEDPDSTSPTANVGGVLTLPPWALRGIGSH
ncbi:MAG: hypothetical protein ABIP49_05450, partial [Lysobacterales bacterium]